MEKVRFQTKHHEVVFCQDKPRLPCKTKSPKQASVQGSNGFADALRLMNMNAEGAVVDDIVQVTPACKKPRLADEVGLKLDITPPPVPGRQTDPCFKALRANDETNETNLLGYSIYQGIKHKFSA